MFRSRFIATLLVTVMALPGCAYAKSGVPGVSGKHNNHTPIEVTSDTLEVMQEQNRAVFSGHVVAVQGDVRLKADTMTVYYAKKDDKGKTDKSTKAAKKPEASEGNMAAGAIKKIEAEGNVFLSTAQETASGANGVYDVEHQEISLNDHVVLTRGKNVLSGDKLTYNFATGKSKLGSSSSDASGKSHQRVKALFVPEKNDSVKNDAPKNDSSDSDTPQKGDQ